MKALHNLIVIKIEDETNKKTATGLVIPKDKWGEKQNVATIEEINIEVEPGRTGALLPKKGDRVLINPYAVLDTPEKELKLIKYTDILAVL